MTDAEAKEIIENLVYTFIDAGYSELTSYDRRFVLDKLFELTTAGE